MKNWRLERGQYLGEISALCFVHLPRHLSPLPFLLAGTGSQVLLYDLVTGKMIRSFQVFEGIRVHGICCYIADCEVEPTSSTVVAFKITVFGERRVKLFTLSIEAGNPQSQLGSCVDLILFHSLPKFNHWVMDVRFFKHRTTSSRDGSHCLAIGCSDNSVLFWDFLESKLNFEVKCSERCLLYSMRMWGDDIEALRVASGTIYNEIVVWKMVPRSTKNPKIDHTRVSNSFDERHQLLYEQYDAVCICRLSGHEGSIFRIVWSPSGSRLISVSDDRSARIWDIYADKKCCNDSKDARVSYSVGPVLFGHCARVWDCSVSDSLIITAGEDCTCRVWRLDGTQVMIIKDHIGRGVWRCLYDPISLLLVTAGFDSRIKVHCLDPSLPDSLERCIEEVNELKRPTEIFNLTIPTSTGHAGLVDSKSEYVRCLQFAREDTLYVATNNGYLYHLMISDSGDVKWTELNQVGGEKVPIVCMKLLSINACNFEDWIAVGDGKGNVTIVRVVEDECSPKVALSLTWSAENVRQLLGIYWCKSLGQRFIFTADPRGRLKLWRLNYSTKYACDDSRNYNVSLLAEFVSCFQIRIMCLDASAEEEVLVCGDLRGNLVLFPLLKGLLLGPSVPSQANITPLNYFKGAHGISSVYHVSIASFNSYQAEIHSTGGDGCICHWEYEKGTQNIEFTGMKQVKELSLVQSVFSNADCCGVLASGDYFIGFASTDFIIWNSVTETKVVQVPCGGWRRPHSYYLGDVPEIQNCFSFVKDEVIFIHRYWVQNRERKIYPLNLHLQFHGREMHSLCFIPEWLDCNSNDKYDPRSKSVWIATGCEDGTVRLTRYAPSVKNWSASKLLGEHVGGSAVRSICCVSKIHIIEPSSANIPSGISRDCSMVEDQETHFLLISVGAKRVLTAWKRKFGMGNKGLSDELAQKSDCGDISSGMSSTMLFQWLSTDMPIKNCSTNEKVKKVNKVVETDENIDNMIATSRSYSSSTKKDIETYFGDKFENDWRYLAVTSFLVKVADSRISVCFVVVACSDATVAVRALVLPSRHWFDIGLLVPQESPVLSLQHIIIPKHWRSAGDTVMGNTYMIISGSTDGSITFWDLTENVETFSRWVSVLHIDSYINHEKKPRTGRGSQGGRWWRSLGSTATKKKPNDGPIFVKDTSKIGKDMQNHAVCGTSNWTTYSEKSMEVKSHAVPAVSLWPEAGTDDLCVKMSNIRSMHVLHKIHQSGVNCLYVSDIKDSKGSEPGFLYNIVSGGDDQALHSFIFDLELLPICQYSDKTIPVKHSISESENFKNCFPYRQNLAYQIRFLYHYTVTSAHSSAIKGIWTDGNWVFSTGLDQRVRCWHMEESGELTERAGLIISVPEPEALDARACVRDRYQIAVAGRGMQMVEFYASYDMDDKE